MGPWTAVSPPRPRALRRGWMLCSRARPAHGRGRDRHAGGAFAALEHPPRGGPPRPAVARARGHDFAYRLRRGADRRRARRSTSPKSRRRTRSSSSPSSRTWRAPSSGSTSRCARPWPHYGGLDSGEIGRRQGVSAEAVRQRLHRGRARLRAELQHHYGSAPALVLALSRIAEERSPAASTRADHAPASAGGVATWMLVAAGAGGLALLLGWRLLGPGPRVAPGARATASAGEHLPRRRGRSAARRTPAGTEPRRARPSGPRPDPARSGLAPRLPGRWRGGRRRARPLRAVLLSAPGPGPSPSSCRAQRCRGPSRSPSTIADDGARRRPRAVDRGADPRAPGTSPAPHVLLDRGSCAEA